MHIANKDAYDPEGDEDQSTLLVRDTYKVVSYKLIKKYGSTS